MEKEILTLHQHLHQEAVEQIEILHLHQLSHQGVVEQIEILHHQEDLYQLQDKLDHQVNEAVAAVAAEAAARLSAP